MTDIADTREQLDDRRLELLRRRLAERGLTAKGEPAASSGGMSDGQRRMWFLQAADPTGAILNVSLSYRITGPLDAARLRDAVNAVAARHEVLRTTYAADADGEPQPTIHDQLAPGWSAHDLSDLSENSRRLRLEVLAQREFGAPFDLGTDAPLRLTLARTGVDEHVLLLVAHHIAWDDGCWRVFFADLTRAYSGEQLGAPVAVPAHAGDPSAEDLAYWRTAMANPPEPLELPGAGGSAIPTNFRSARTTLRLPASTVDRVTALAKDSGATPYMVLLAAFGVLIHRYTYADDFLVAAPVLNRTAELDNVIGYYGNTVAMRLRPQRRETFREVLAHTRDTTVGAFAHQNVNLDRIVRELNPDRRHGAERMTRVSFGARGADGDGFNPAGITCERADLRAPFTQLPLGFMVEFGDAGVEVEAEYLVEILDAALVRQLLEHYAVLLDSALANPDEPISDLELMGAADLEWLQKVSAGEEFCTPAQTLATLVESQVDRTPDAVAVVYEGCHYTYREINEAANRFAHWLIGRGIGTEDRIAVLLDRSPELVITALGVVKAGAIYLPVDPTYPEDRLNFILSDSDPKLILREPVTGLDGMPDDNPTDTDRVRPLYPDSTAYLIYTSGSTGLPKGVPVAHLPVAEYFVWFKRDYAIDEGERLLQVASPSFDVSIGEIFGMLGCGARLVIPRPDGLRDIGYLTDLLHDEGITSMHFVPSLLGLFLSLPGVNQWRTLQRVPIGGEALPGELADKFHSTFDALLHNFYGPTETVINASRYKVEGKQGTRIVPIGTPKINTQIHLLDDALQPVPVGVIGEIYIGGPHVAQGYHRRPRLTAERFVADPFTPGARLYRSGDLARRNADGDVEFVGRADEQVKIRGFRIELGEVAAAISVDPSVGQAVVVVSDLPNLGKSLVGYLTPADDGEIVDIDRIRARVGAALPEYMTPAAYVVLDEIPITAHGKIDSKALPEPDIGSGVEYREPAEGTERQIAALFAELLGHDSIGADDSFFEMGGHSLLATKLVAAVRDRCNVDIGVREVFELGTVAALAERVDASSAVESQRPRLVAIPRGGPLQLSASQLRMWFQYRVDGPNPVNNIPFAARLTGPCDTEAFVQAMRDVIARHEVLRTTYREIDGVPYQIINEAGDVAVRRARGDGESWLQTELDKERRHVFELERTLPIRAAVLSTSDAHVVSLVVHHIAADHWSAMVLFNDLLTAYRARRSGQAPEFAPLDVQYADYAAWQAALLADADGPVVAQRDYWRRQLAGLREGTGLTPDFTRPEVLSGAGDAVEFSIDAATRSKFAELSHELGVTEFMLLQSAVAIALHKAGEGTDIPIGTPVAGRTEAALDQLIGFFVNIVVLRNDLSGNPSLREVLRGARDTALEAYANQDLPFDHVVDAVKPARSLSRNPLFNVVVHVREALPVGDVVDSGGDGDTVFTALEPPFDVAHADLSVNFFAAAQTAGSAGGDEGYRCHVIYRTDLYRRESAERLVRWLGRVLFAFADDPDQRLRDVLIADREERRRVHDYGIAARVSVLDHWRDAAAVGVIGDVYDHENDGETTFLRATGKRARWTTDGYLDVIEADAPAPEGREGPAGSFEPARTDTERTLAAMLAEALEVPEIGRNDNFFSLGGDSIMAVQLAARARDAGIPLTARMVFERPAIHELAATVDAADSDSQNADAHHDPMAASGLSDDELAAVTAWFSSTGAASEDQAP
ncbi:amino acid adenylation enzyme/thioester reductase family protein [Mycolicibacterium rhodesiae NBB3]|uniref:Amino acid adenylation enzyme/thioester reductase family protein n=1 Tax=Mycolicibacterium rhodesiae (strain NBB3) TaxID=710685 RepID=G8RKN2_MYCRN|nr:non-ribosomal peptide synthetase [Mycolicibacterium rhodesiae]AEV74823.1 amino acid adenylation enzyme/thioester reductase family protein [Mycolicibacterium rhodesiae NBB3]